MEKRRIVFCFALFVTSIFITQCDKGKAIDPEPNIEYYQMPVALNDGWQTASLGDVGIDVLTIDALLKRLEEDDGLNFHSMLLVKDSLLVMEQYFDGLNREGEMVQWDRETLHRTASVTKSFTSILFGIAQHQGVIGALSDKALDYYPEYNDITDSLRINITLEHLLTMSPGLDWDEWSYPFNDSRNDVVQLFIQDDPIRYVFERPMIADPGEAFHYNSGVTNILGDIVRKTTGSMLSDYAKEFLFEPLGFTRCVWYLLTDDIIFASGDLQLYPREMIRFGQLCLQRGWWNGEQIVPAQWIDDSVVGRISSWGNTTYGYQWWIEDFVVDGRTIHSYAARGWGEQNIFIFPELNLVFSCTAGHYNNDPNLSMYQIITQYILPSVLSDN